MVTNAISTNAAATNIKFSPRQLEIVRREQLDKYIGKYLGYTKGKDMYDFKISLENVYVDLPKIDKTTQEKFLKLFKITKRVFKADKYDLAALQNNVLKYFTKHQKFIAVDITYHKDWDTKTYMDRIFIKLAPKGKLKFETSTFILR